MMIFLKCCLVKVLKGWELTDGLEMVTLRIGDDCLGWTCLFLPPAAAGVVAGLVLWFPWDLVLTTIFTGLLLTPSCEFSNFVQKSVSQSSSIEFDTLLSQTLKHSDGLLWWLGLWTFCGAILLIIAIRTDEQIWDYYLSVKGLCLSDWAILRNFQMIDDQFEKTQSYMATRQQDRTLLF